MFRDARPGARGAVYGTRALLILLILLLGVLAAGCGDDTESTEQSSTGVEVTTSLPQATGEVDSITWALYAEPTSLDFAYLGDFPPMEVVANLLEPLLRLQPDMSLAPCVAESYESPDPLTWVYNIRPGITFHDGTELTAEDVTFCLQRQIDPKVGSFASYIFTNVESIEQTGPMQVTVHMKQPDVLFNEQMCESFIDSKAFIEEAGEKYGTPDGGILGSGPFQFESWEKGQSIVVSRYDAYWDAALRPLTAQVEFVFIADSAARVNAMLSGEVDGSWFVPSEGFPRLSSADTGKLYFGPTAGSYVAMLTSQDGGLRDQRVRMALSYAIDRVGIIEAALSGAAEPGRAPAPPTSWGYAKETFADAYEDLPSVTQNLEEAKRLVAEAGVPSEPITIAVTAGRSEMAIISAEMQSAGKKLGLDVQIKALPADSYNALYSDEKAREGIDFILSLWLARTPDPLSFYQYFRSTDFYNYAHYNNPEVDDLLTKAVAESDPQARADLVVPMQQQIVEDVIWLPLYNPYNALYLSSGLTGAPTSPVQIFYPWAATIGAPE